MDTLAASLEGGEPQPSCGETDATAWYLFAPTASGRAQVDTFGTSLDTILAVYSGTPGQLHPVGCRDNAEGTRQSKVVFDFASGTNYYIQAGGKVYRYGTIVVNLQEVSVPPNDNFADAAAITPRPFRFDGDTAGATMENEEGEPHLAAGCNLLVLDQTAGYENLDNSVWFRYTTPSRGVATASGTATRFTPRIAVYAGDNMESLTSPMGLRCSDSSKEFIVGPDQTYYIQLAGVDAAAGPYRFTFNVTP
ncbi:MAG: hypothetical protein HY814_01310 [Candidatus Riflebacteria bacterium]|nr:hypothetical protein [Candidatus Riflebacteria bacterium]